MSGKVLSSSEGLTADFAGMTKSQLYDIMSQMKTLIEQNKQQARDILIQNPPLTKALFQAQIMLGMVQAPQVIPTIQPTLPQPSVGASQPVNAQAMNSLARGFPDQVGTSQVPSIIRKHQLVQPSAPVSTPATLNLQPQTVPSSLLQTAKTHPNLQVTPAIMPQSSLPSIPPSQPSLHQHQMSAVPVQLQQPTGMSHIPLQSSIQSRPPPVSSLHHQYGAQLAPNAGYQQTGVPPHPSQPIYHSQQPMSHQLSVQPQFLSGGANVGLDFNNAVGSQTERVSSRIPGPLESSGQPSLTPEMEQTLLQQVMSLAPEQINNLPPEQRHQVLQLQQMLRQKKLG